MSRFLLLCSLLFAAYGCSGSKPSETKKKDVAAAELTAQGNARSEKGKFDEAVKLFRKAFEYVPGYWPAYAGLIRATALNTESKTAPAQVAEWIKKGLKNANDDEGEFGIHSAAVQYYASAKKPSENRYRLARENFAKAIAVWPRKPDPYLYMARANLANFDLKEARKNYRKLQERKSNVEEATFQLAFLEKMLYAQPGTLLGRQYSFLKYLTRKQAAELLALELKPRNYPQKSPKKKSTKANDAKHPRVVEILAFNYDGLRTNSYGKFHPEKPWTRIDFAKAFYDIVPRVAAKPKSSTKTKAVGGTKGKRKKIDYGGAFKKKERAAIEFVVSMKLLNLAKGDKFLPYRSISGEEALVAIRKVKDYWRKRLSS